jgi:hypothetical protein
MHNCTLHNVLRSADTTYQSYFRVFQVNLEMRFKFMMCYKSERNIVLLSKMLLIFFYLLTGTVLFPFPSNSDSHRSPNAGLSLTAEINALTSTPGFLAIFVCMKSREAWLKDDAS